MKPMNIDPSIFKAYDIRGLYPEQINEENIGQIIKSIYVFFTQKLGKKTITVAVGKDMRTSTPSLSKIAIDTLIELGANVVDIGLVSTPTFYFAVSHNNYESGLQITASHNPKQYNGVKFVINSGHGLIKIGKPTGMEDVKNLALSDISFVPDKKGSVTEKTGSAEEEVQNALRIMGNPTINKYKVVADPANAMGILYLEAVFNTVPAELIKMNFELDGTFPVHQPDPLDAKNLVDLQKRVIEEKADLGLAPDGDGDRLFFIDEKGEIVPPTIITSIVARELLVKHPGERILFDIRYIFTPKKIVEENGGTWGITKVGHAFITEELNKGGGIFAGESSAHYFFKETGNAESQLPMIITVLAVMTRENKKLSEIVEELRRSYESGEFNFKVANAPEILSLLKEKYKDGEYSDLDGIAVTYPDWRFNVRTSNTEPLLRLNVESYIKETMEQKRDELMNIIKSAAK